MKGSSEAIESHQSSQDQPYDLNCCKECGKPFKNLKNHLSRAHDCRRNYDLGKLNSEIESLKRKKTRPGLGNVKPEGWFKYSLQKDKGVVLDCSTMSLSTWETYIWSILN